MSNSKVSKGTVVESSQSIIAAEVQRHLPSSDVVGTFSLGKRVATPSGAVVPARRPSSAMQALSRGASSGAEECRPRAQLLLERAACARPSASIVAHITRWILETETALRVEHQPDEVTPVEDGNYASSTLSLLTPHALRNAWASEMLLSGKHRHWYPSVSVAVPDAAQRGPLDRLATLLHAIAEFKTRMEAGKTPVMDVEGQRHCHAISGNAGSGGAMLKRPLVANAASRLFGRSLRAEHGVDVRCGTDFTARHITLALGSHFYAVEIFHPNGQPLYASEIKQRLLAAIEHAQQSPHPHSYLARVCQLSKLSVRQWSEECAKLVSACQANRYSVEAMDRSLLCVTLLSSADNVSGDLPYLPHEVEHVAAWTGCGLQLEMLPSGTCVFRSNGLDVDLETLMVLGMWTSNAANADPMLSPPACRECTVPAVRRVPLCQVRPSTAQQKGGKGSAAAAATPAAMSQQELDALMEETSSLVNIAVKTPEKAATLRPLPLWLPIANEARLQTLDLRPPFAMHNFLLSVGPPETIDSATIDAVVELAAILACGSVLRPAMDSLPPLVRHAKLSAVSCPSQVLLVSESVEMVMRLLRGGMPRRTQENIQAIALVVSRVADMIKSVESSPDGQLLPMATVLSKQGRIPGRPTLRSRGECCAPPDVTITRSIAPHPQDIGLLWTTECHIGGQDARFAVSYSGGESSELRLCSLIHRRGDEECANRFVDAMITACETLACFVSMPTTPSRPGSAA